MYLIRNSKQLVQSYPNFLAEWYTTQQIFQHAWLLMDKLYEEGNANMTSYSISSWEYAGLTENLNYHVFTADLPEDYGGFMYDMLFDTVNEFTYPVSHVLPIISELQNPPIERNGLWFSKDIEESAAIIFREETVQDVNESLFNTLNFSISVWIYTTYDTIDTPILYKGKFDDETREFSALEFALFADKWMSATKTTNFDRPTPGVWHLYTITVQNDTVSIYIDNSLVAQDTGHSYTFGTDIIRISMSKDLSQSSPPNYFDGAVSELILWNQVLTESDVIKIYQDDLTTLQSKIAFAWPMYKIVSDESSVIRSLHAFVAEANDFIHILGWIIPSTGTEYGYAYVTRIIDMNIPKTPLLWTHTDTKLILYVPTHGELAYQNIFWIPQTITDIHKYLFFTKFHNFTLKYVVLNYVPSGIS